MELEAVAVHPRPISESVLEIVTPDIEAKSLELALLIDEAVPATIIGDPTRLRQILLNLIGNAIKFTESGWIRVSVKIDTAKPEPAIRFEIQDTGIGISVERQAGLFQAFSQAETSTTRRFGGTGLGLSICARLVELMEGSIGVESREGEGSVFWFTVPARAPDQPGPAAAENIDLSDISVLVVEQSEPVRAMITSLLTAAGCIVVAKDTLTDAAKEARHHDHHVLVLDCRMHGDGLGALAQQFNSPADFPSARKIRVIAKPPREGAAAPTIDLVRPIRRESLLKSVAAVLGRSSPDLPSIEEDGTGVAIEPPALEDALAQGRLILVAEDNATNREMVLRQLNLLGFAAEVAEDGAYAFDMRSKRTYGLVVTDCHMPNIDGFELTRKIRDVERDLGTHTPIVALTANALAGEAERCLNAGMDDYLSKPVGLKRLRQTILRWLPETEEPMAGPPDLTRQTSHASGTREPETGSALIDLAILEELFEDDREGMREMMDLFLRNADRLIGEIDTALQSADAAALEKSGHGLKGAANAIGVERIGLLAQKIEQAGQDGDFSTCTGLRAALDREFKAVRDFIGKF